MMKKILGMAAALMLGTATMASATDLDGPSRISQQTEIIQVQHRHWDGSNERRWDRSDHDRPYHRHWDPVGGILGIPGAVVRQVDPCWRYDRWQQRRIYVC